VYSIDDEHHAGLLKVGQTTRNVKQRVAEQVKTAGIKKKAAFKEETDEMHSTMKEPFVGAVGRKRVDRPNSDPEVWCGRPVSDKDGGSIVQDEMGFVEFERVGAAFLRISRSVFEDLIAAHPEWKRPGHSGMPDDIKANYYRFFRFCDDDYETGEDFAFCDAWRAIGGRIWVDPDQMIGHVGEKNWEGAFSEILTAKEATP
jgi:hypothetical protein